MDLGRIIQRLINMILRRGINTAIRTGVNKGAAKGKAPKDMTPAERAQAAKGREVTKRARQAARITRRMGR